MARKINSKFQRTVPYTIVGAGKTERFYFSHLRDIYNLKVFIKSRFFGNENFPTLEKRIDSILKDEGKVIAVFDIDVSSCDPNVMEQYRSFAKKYAGNKNVILCPSLPSIEYWFLLHYLQTTRHYPSSKSAMDALKSYIPDFDKKEAFLQNSKWVEEMCADHKLASAYTRSKTETEFIQSHTDLWKAIDAMDIPV